MYVNDFVLYRFIVLAYNDVHYFKADRRLDLVHDLENAFLVLEVK